MINSCHLIEVPGRQANPAYVLIIEMAHGAAICLDLVHHMDGATDLDHFASAIPRTKEVERQVTACCPQGRDWTSGEKKRQYQGNDSQYGEKERRARNTLVHLNNS